ncbi:hypothetical protein Tco_1501714 [Tanacetum coccineum]
MLWEWRGIANMDFIKLGGSSRVLSVFAEKYGSKNRVLAGFGIGGKSGKEKVYKLGCDRERLKMIKVDFTLIWLRLHTLFHPVSCFVAF